MISNFRRMTGVLMLLLSFLCCIMPQIADAHATLVKATPEPNTRLQQSPEKITLTFNERIEGTLFYIKVFDHYGKKVTDRPAVLNKDHMGIHLKLPKLNDGIYTVSWHVLSEDGHPVEGSYVLTVGQALSADPERQAQTEHQLHQGHNLSTDMSPMDALKYIARMVYYFALLSAAGWMLWSFLMVHGSEAFQKSCRLTALNLQRLHLLTLLFMIFIQYQDLVGSEGGLPFADLFTRTGLGVSWLISLALSLLGFVVLLRNVWIDRLWAAALLGAKSFTGHAVAFTPEAATVSLDFVHLLAASIWVGGLWLLLLCWRKYRMDAKRIMPVFSNTALVSIAVLVVSGLISTMLFLPKWSYLLYTQWGKLLLMKTFLVVLVVVTASMLRYFMRKQADRPLGTMVKADAALMVGIVAIVGIFTYISPLPPNEPLHWHVMGKEIHMTAEITPNVPGDNRFLVKVWLPEKEGAPKQVLLRLRSLDEHNRPPIQVPLAPFKDEEFDEFPGFAKYAYSNDGPYLPFAGKWLIEVRVMDPNDNETVYKKEMKIY